MFLNLIACYRLLNSLTRHILNRLLNSVNRNIIRMILISACLIDLIIEYDRSRLGIGVIIADDKSEPGSVGLAVLAYLIITYFNHFFPCFLKS